MIISVIFTFGNPKLTGKPDTLSKHIKSETLIFLEVLQAPTLSRMKIQKATCNYSADLS